MDGFEPGAAAAVTRTRVDQAIGAVWRIESAKIVAGVARLVRDIGLAEELAGDALVAALEHWPVSGIPDNPGAWLMRTAKNAALDHLRRDKTFREKCVQIGHDLDAQEAHIVPDFVDDLDAARNDVVHDDLLRLMFTACHPILSTEARVTLTLKLLGGLSTGEIARAFLVPEPTIAQRIVRAKRTLGQARVPFELPPAAELAERLGSVLEVVYLIFNEGYTATSGGDWMRPALQDEALRLGRMLAQLAPREPEAQGLVALMELQASRAALTLKLLGGLSTLEIARAFLVPETTVAQRIVRAKRTLQAARVPFEVPPTAERKARLASVLQVIYLIYNEGYSASAGADWLRPGLCREALRLGRVLAGLMPLEGEVHGLVALMEIQSSRERARTGPQGEPILLLDQDRTRWDRLLIRRGLDALERAAGCGSLGPYALQAAIAACHARALTPEATDWVGIAALYDALAHLLPSPVVELNRAVALGMAYGPAEGLALLETLLDEPSLRNYHLLPSVRGDLLAKLGRHAEARAEFAQAADLTHNERERTLLLARARA